MKNKKTGLLWRCDPANNKVVENELKKRGKALLDYARKTGIRHISLFIIGDDYISICAKPESRSDDYIVDAHAFLITEEHKDE